GRRHLRAPDRPPARRRPLPGAAALPGRGSGRELGRDDRPIHPGRDGGREPAPGGARERGLAADQRHAGGPRLDGLGCRAQAARGRAVGGGRAELTLPGARPVRAPRGPELSCRGWPQEAALRMLMNNLDPDVAERPDDLVVYGGTGRAARSWEAFDAIVRSLRSLADDETLLVQSGKPVGVFRTHEWAPRVLIANSNLVPEWATWDEFRRLEQLGL